MSLGARIEKLLQDRGWSQAELARRVGVKPTSIWKVVAGETQSPRNLREIARELGTSQEFLMGETDDAMPPPNVVHHAAHKSNASDSDVVELDYVDLRFGLGGSYVDGPVTVEKQQFSRGWLEQITRSPPELLFWAETDGDSMEPTIRSGEIILGDRSQTTPRFGDGIWAIAMGEIGMIKRLRPLPNGTVEIHSDNPVVPPATAVDGEMHVIGRVVAVVRRL